MTISLVSLYNSLSYFIFECTNQLLYERSVYPDYCFAISNDKLGGIETFGKARLCCLSRLDMESETFKQDPLLLVREYFKCMFSGVMKDRGGKETKSREGLMDLLISGQLDSIAISVYGILNDKIDDNIDQKDLNLIERLVFQIEESEQLTNIREQYAELPARSHSINRGITQGKADAVFLKNIHGSTFDQLKSFIHSSLDDSEFERALNGLFIKVLSRLRAGGSIAPVKSCTIVPATPTANVSQKSHEIRSTSGSTTDESSNAYKDITWAIEIKTRDDLLFNSKSEVLSRSNPKKGNEIPIKVLDELNETNNSADKGKNKEINSGDAQNTWLPVGSADFGLCKMNVHLETSVKENRYI